MLIYVKNRKIKVTYDGKTLNLPKKLENDINRNWKKEIIKTPELWNGDIFCVKNLVENDNEIILNCSKTNYAHYLYDERIGCPKEYGNYGLSAGMFFETSDEYYVIGKLSKTTSFPNGLSIQGGSVDQKDVMTDGTVDIEATMRREAIEEINFDIKNKNEVENYEIKYISPATEKIKTYEIICKGKLKLNANEVRKHFKKYYEYLKENNLEMEYEDIILLKKETALKELKKMSNPKRKYLLDIIEADSILDVERKRNETSNNI